MSDNPADDGGGRASLKMMKASVLHLVDLKRAGCSPKYCELRVNSRDRITHLPRQRPGPRFGHKTKPSSGRRS